MKVVFFLQTFPNPSETFILNQITGLIDRGLTVRIVSQFQSEHKVSHARIEEYDLMSKTSYVCIPTNDLALILRALFVFIKIPKKKWFNTVRLMRDEYKKSGPSRMLEILFDIYPLIREKNVDIIHCHFGHNGEHIAFLKSYGLVSAQVITTFHGYDMSRLIQKYGSDMYSYLKKYGDLNLPISEYWKNKLIHIGFDHSRIVVSRMGVNVKMFHCKQSWDQKKTLKLLTVARFVEKKGIEYAISAVHVVTGSFSKGSIEYNIVGLGPLQDRYEALIHNLSLEDTVHLLGPKTQEEVCELMNSSDVFILPSVTASDGDQEGIPVSLMEAMATGLTVITTYHTGIPELVDDGLNGFMVQERDTAALADRLAALIDNPSLLISIARESRKTVASRFNNETILDELVGIYESQMP